MRIMAGPPVVSVARPTTQYAAAGFSGGMDQRDRKGAASFSAYIEAGLPWRYAEQNRILQNAELWQVYKIVPDVRACIDAICRKISTWDWGVLPTMDPSDPRYEQAMELAETVRRFLAAPNTDGETWQEWVTKLVRDVLVYDALASENVTNSKGQLVELVALNGGEVTAVIDNKQRLQGYRQQNRVGQVINFEPDEILYMNLHGNTVAPGGVPIIETLVLEVVTLMRGAQNLMKLFDADEHPPGILFLAGLQGDAAQRMTASFKQMKGNEDRLRVVTAANPAAMDVKWIEMRQNPKNLQMRELVHEIRRTVWRLFGCKPVSMGDTEATPRATAEVQVDEEQSGLIGPFLELFEQKLNTRVIPLIVGDAEMAGLVAFEFDRGKRKTPAQEKDEAARDASDFDRGAMTVNERRAVRGLAPVEEGDTLLIKSGVGYRPLADVVAGKADPSAVSPFGGAPAKEDPSGEDKDEGVDVDAKNDEGSGDDKGPGEAEADEAAEDADEKQSRPVQAQKRAALSLSTTGRAPLVQAARHHAPPARSAAYSALEMHRGCACESEMSYRGVRAATDLPSDWQPAGRFKNARTIALPELGQAIIGYQRAIGPLYRQARVDIIAATRARLGDGKIDNSELAQIATEVTRELDSLSTKWSAGTETFYRKAAKLGRDAAVDFTKNDQVATQWKQDADGYHRRAMNYLTGTGGLLTDIRTQAMELLTGAVRSRQRMVQRAETIDAGIDVAGLLGALRKVFEANEHRIGNWSGRLVELANNTLSTGMQEGNGQVTSADTTKAVNWYFEWCDVGDSATCPTCVREAGLGFRPVTAMTRQPGGDTECRGKCRCVLQFVLESEVKDGTAISLANLGRSRRGRVVRATPSRTGPVHGRAR